MSVKQLFDLTGKVALVTGGSRGLGLQMAEALGGMGARVAITARKAEGLQEAQARLNAKGIETLTIANDLSRLDQIPALVDAVLAQYGSIDILVNNAGTNWFAPAASYPDEAWRKLMTLNIDAVFFLSREVGRRCMIPRQSGKIINIASVAGLSGTPQGQGIEIIGYSASKGAVVNFPRALAAEWGRHNINVNAICPGIFPSKMTHNLLRRIGDQIIAATPLGRLGGNQDLMGAAVFLASEASRHITGQYITVDGGAGVAK